MSINIDCSFCQEINGLSDYNFFEIYLRTQFLHANLDNRIVAKTKNFVLMPMVGPLVPGYLLIVSKDHYYSFSHMPLDLLEETRLIKETLTELFSKVFSRPVYFEHGAMSDVCRGGCCSVHAHMHCVAVDVDIEPELKQSELKVKEINNFNEIRVQSCCNKPYLYYENQINKKYLIEVEEIESQFIRKKIGIKMGIVDRLEWSQNIQYQWMIDTIKRVTPFFNNLKGTSIWQ